MAHRVLSAVVVAALACGHLTGSLARAGNKCRNAEARTSADYLEPGPYPVGQTTLEFVDTSRATPPNGDYPGAPDRTLVTEVWFPATSAGGAIIDPSGAPYPIIMNSHGFTSSRVGLTYLTVHLASHGYVVGSVDYPLSNIAAPGGPTVDDVPNQVGDLSFALDRILEIYGSAIDTGRIGAQGYSLGGMTTLIATYHPNLRDPRLTAAASIAGAGCSFTKRMYKTTRTPLLILHGDDDLLVPIKENGKRPYKLARGPKHMVTLATASHTGFSTFAGTQDGSIHIDTIGCAAIDRTLDVPQVGEPNGLDALGGKKEGINPNRCPLPCEGGVPERGSMPGARQHELAKISILPFFEAYLRDDLSARCFLKRTLEREHDDVKVKGR